MILAGAFTVAPWLKYPPNPPAVGDPGTLAERQGLYVAVICIAAALGLGATILEPAAAGRGVAGPPPAGGGGGRRGGADAPAWLFVDSDRRGWLDLGWRNREEWGFPTGPDFVYAKAFEWEIRRTPVAVRRVALPDLLCVELKHLHGEEFAHWTDPASFATSWRNQRKRREWEVFHALRAGQVPDGVVEVTAPDGVHVVDHVIGTVLPAMRAAPLARRCDAGHVAVRFRRGTHGP